jgi:hypothetical protein
MSPQIQTYHCLCTSLLFATTHTITQLPRRAAPSLDKAIILPLSPLAPQEGNAAPELTELGYTAILGMTPERRAVIVRKADGFEKRLMWRCNRCRLVIAYDLNGMHYTGDGHKGQGQEGDTEGDARANVLYLLPGGIMNTEAMAAGTKIAEGQVSLDVETGTLAAFETS